MKDDFWRLCGLSVLLAAGAGFVVVLLALILLPASP